MLDYYLDVIATEVSKSIEDIDKEVLHKVKDIILYAEKNGNRVHITGIGKPSYIAGYFASLLSSTGTPSYFLDGTEAVHGSSGQVKSGDVVIALSNSGETHELLYSVRTLKDNGAILIACTSDPKSHLAQISTATLVAKANAEGDSLNKPPRASILAEVIVLQALSVVLQEAKDLDVDTYVNWHPGGALGRGIKKEQEQKGEGNNEKN